MSLHSNRLAFAVAFGLLLFVFAAMATQVEVVKPPRRHSLERMKAIRTIESKLEEFVKNDTNPLPDYMELYSASCEYESWPQDEKDAIRSSPDLRLVIDTTIAPIKRLKNQRPEHVVQLIKDYYRKFRPAYLLGRQINAPTSNKIAETRKLFSKLTRQSKEELVYGDFVAGKEEAVRLLNRMNELATIGLGPDNSVEFAGIVNLFNAENLKPLFIFVYPSMKRPTNLRALKSRFDSGFARYGWVYDVNKYVKRANLSEDDLKLAGFMYVV